MSVTYGNWSRDRYAIFGWREEDECTAVSEINNLFITDACGKNTFQDKSSKFRRHCSAKITVSSWSMEPNKAYYYDIAKRYLTLIGQWPYQKPKESLFFMIFVLFFDANVLSTQVTLTIVGIFLKESNYNSTTSLKLRTESNSLFVIKLTRDCNHIFQAARFFVCDNMQCIFETLPPHLLAAIIPVKIFTYRFNSRKVRSVNMYDIGILILSRSFTNSFFAKS